MPHVITSCWLFVAVDHDGDEGLISLLKEGQWFPLVASDARRLEQWRELAQEAASAYGKTVKLLRFDGPPVLVEVLEPRKGQA